MKKQQKSKYPLIEQMKGFLSSKPKKQPTGAGSRRDDKLLKAERKALGMKDKMKSK